MSSVQLGPDLGIEYAPELKDLLAPLLAQPEPVVIAADPVGKVHTAGLQVLCAFIRDRRQAGLATRLEPCADSLKDAAGRLGLSAELGLA